MRQNVIVVFIGLLVLMLSPVYSQQISINNVGNAPKAAVFIESLKSDNPIGTGTAFKVKYSTAIDAGEFVFLVTAKHVIENGDTIRIYLNRNLNQTDKIDGKSKIYSEAFPMWGNGVALWEPARDNVDISVLFLDYIPKMQIESRNTRAEQYMQKASTTTEEIWIDNLIWPISSESLENLPEDDLADVFYMGYPLGLRSNEWLRAFTRRCTIALPTMEGIHIQGVNEKDFLIDCAPFEGDSGSPVFIHEVKLTPEGLFNSIDTRLIGVMLGYISWNEIAKTSSKTRDMEIDTEIRKKNILGMGKVAPVRYIGYAIQDFLARTDVK